MRRVTVLVLATVLAALALGSTQAEPRLATEFPKSAGISAFPDWVPHSGNPIVHDPAPSTLSFPTIILDGGVYKAWGGRDPIKYGTSTDGLNWSLGTPLPTLSVGPAGSFDQNQISFPSVFFNPSKQLYEMWYTGRLAGGFTDTRIGYATSADGINWTKVPGSGTGGSVLDKGGPDQGEGINFALVLLEGATYKMWYHGQNPSGTSSPSGIFYAESNDGINWTKLGKVINKGLSGTFDFAGQLPVSIIRANGEYQLWYIIDNDQNPLFRGTAYATSPDGISWTKHGLIAVPDEPWCSAPPPDCAVKTQHVLLDGSTYKMWYRRGAAPDFIGYAEASLLMEVDIDIKPGSFPNSINPKSKGVIPVAVLSTDDFDATQVDAATVLFGPGEASPRHSKKDPLGHFEDVDDDGDIDVIFHFNTQDTGIACGDTEATLTGQTLDGRQIEGTDSIQTVGCK